MRVLRGWSDSDIMECDILRLDRAVTVVSDATDSEWRARYKIGGFNIKEPGWDREMGDDEFNSSLGEALVMFSRQGQR
ncbi:hypothetical protein [Pararhizobium haloflavum]|uniref:hypothetical protein n=1 Tax=Pararhizobium haloflavum TaxID=2037914 RepID=UPI0012FFE89B|nr:hypothetical protein [Pararhizobium haloflavum]